MIPASYVNIRQLWALCHLKNKEDKDDFWWVLFIMDEKNLLNDNPPLSKKKNKCVFFSRILPLNLE